MIWDGLATPKGKGRALEPCEKARRFQRGSHRPPALALRPSGRRTCAYPTGARPHSIGRPVRSHNAEAGRRFDARARFRRDIPIG